MIRTAYIILLCLFCAPMAMADDFTSLIEQGNQAYEKQEYNTALDLYRQAETERPESPEIYYNLGNALQQTGKFENSVEKYESALNSDDISLLASTYYNGGNGFFKQEEYQKAIEWYQKSLELNPDDMDAKYNLELARNRLREQMKRQQQDQQQEDQQQQDQQEQQEQEQQEEQQQQDQQQQQQEQPKEEEEEEEQKQDKADEQSSPNENQDQQEEQQVQPQPQPKEDEMSEEDALRVLNALRDQEKEDQEKIKRFKAKGKYQGKDW